MLIALTSHLVARPRREMNLGDSVFDVGASGDIGLIWFSPLRFPHRDDQTIALPKHGCK
jgi:hypothetical protein